MLLFIAASFRNMLQWAIWQWPHNDYLVLLIFVVMNPIIEKKPETAGSTSAGFNPDKQHTLKSPVSISGTGLHTGVMADLTFKPAIPGFGFQFPAC